MTEQGPAPTGGGEPGTDLERVARAQDDPAAAARHDVATPPPPGEHGQRGIPFGLAVTAGWAWRLIAIALAVGIGLWVVARVQLVLVPFLIALLLSALLQPVAGWLVRRGLPRALAAAITMLGAVVVIGLLVWLVVHEFRNGWGDLQTRVDGGVDKIQRWLIEGPLNLSQEQIDKAFESGRRALSENRSTLTTGAVGAASTAGHVLTGLLLCLFATFFLLKDGRQIFGWFVRLLPRGARAEAVGAGDRAWRTLIHYVRATVAVAVVDAVGIGVGAAILGVPLAVPLGVVVFLSSFIPIVGATASGLVAVLVALVATNLTKALILLGIVIAVQQLEGHVLQPLLLGRAVNVHPLAIVFAIAAGVLLAGIVGALIAVPLVAVANTVSAYLSRGDRTVAPLEAPESP